MLQTACISGAKTLPPAIRIFPVMFYSCNEVVTYKNGVLGVEFEAGGKFCGVSGFMAGPNWTQCKPLAVFGLVKNVDGSICRVFLTTEA